MYREPKQHSAKKQSTEREIRKSLETLEQELNTIFEDINTCLELILDELGPNSNNSFFNLFFEEKNGKFTPTKKANLIKNHLHNIEGELIRHLLTNRAVIEIAINNLKPTILLHTERLYPELYGEGFLVGVKNTAQDLLFSLTYLLYFIKLDKLKPTLTEEKINTQRLLIEKIIIKFDFNEYFQENVSEVERISIPWAILLNLFFIIGCSSYLLLPDNKRDQIKTNPEETIPVIYSHYSEELPLIFDSINPLKRNQPIQLQLLTQTVTAKIFEWDYAQLNSYIIDLQKIYSALYSGQITIWTIDLNTLQKLQKQNIEVQRFKEYYTKESFDTIFPNPDEAKKAKDKLYTKIELYIRYAQDPNMALLLQ